MHYPDTKLWRFFVVNTDIDNPFLLVKDVYKWWRVDVVSKLKSIYKVLSLFIIWQIWKRRYMVNHTEKISLQSMRLEICRNLYYMVKFICPRMSNISYSWIDIVHYLEEYSSRIYCKLVYWTIPRIGMFKCNSDGAARVIQDPILMHFVFEMRVKILSMQKGED